MLGLCHKLKNLNAVRQNLPFPARSITRRKRLAHAHRKIEDVQNCPSAEKHIVGIEIVGLSSYVKNIRLHNQRRLASTKQLKVIHKMNPISESFFCKVRHVRYRKTLLHLHSLRVVYLLYLLIILSQRSYVGHSLDCLMLIGSSPSKKNIKICTLVF